MTYNYQKGILSAITVLLCGVSFVSFDASAQIAQVKAWLPPEEEINVPEDYKPYMLEAMQLHMTQVQLNNMKNTMNLNLSMAEKKTTLAQDQMTALTECNVKKLSEIYKNPEEAWLKMTEDFEKRDNDMTIYINASTPDKPADEWDDAHPHWRIGRELLIDVYANPSKYGEVHTEFKRWKDQDYIYAEQVNGMLTDVAAIFGVSVIPGVSRENAYGQNKTAYEVFLNKMKEKEPKKFALLKPEMLNFPLPPEPLPPANEIIKLTQMSSQGQLFPSMPEPWAYYVKNERVKRLPNGEMNEYYQPDSLQLRSEVGKKSIFNRFEVYQSKKSGLAMARNVERIYQKTVDETEKHITKKLKELKVDIEPDFKNTDAIQEAIIGKKRVAIKKARDLLNDWADYEASNTSDRLRQFQSLAMADKLKALDEFDRKSEEYTAAVSMMNADQRKLDEEYLDALEEDIEGTTVLTEDNAHDVKQLMKSATAQAELVRAIYNEDEKNVAKLREKKIDDDCLNGGV